jgi:hypothetical protein
MKRSMKFFGMSLALLFLAAAPGFLRAQEEVGLKMDVDKRQLEVGDTLTLTLDFKQVGTSNSAVVQEPSIPSSENFEIRGDFSSNRVQMLGNNLTAVSTTTYRMEATKAGTVQLGPASLIYQDPSGKRREMQSNIVTVVVTEKTGFSLFGKKSAEPTPAASGAAPAAVPSPDDLRAIKGLPPDSFSWWTFLFWLVVLILIVGFIWRQYRKKPAGPAKVILVGKAEELNRAWKKLADDNLEPKEFTLGLSNLVRECLQYRFGFEAVDYTTEEILKELSKIKAGNDEKSAVEKCLKTSDRVLYADGNLTGREALRSACAVLLPKNKKD